MDRLHGVTRAAVLQEGAQVELVAREGLDIEAVAAAAERHLHCSSLSLTLAGGIRVYQWRERPTLGFPPNKESPRCMGISMKSGTETLIWRLGFPQ